jgi:hypothetical protein
MTAILGTSQKQLGKLHKTLFIEYGKIEQWLVRQTHNLKVAGSNPALAIIKYQLVGVSACGGESHGFKSRYLPINGEIEQFGSLSGS